MADVARTLWELPRAPGAPKRVWRDWVLVGAFVVIAVIEAIVRRDEPWLWPTFVVELALIATLLWRRTHPGLMVAIALGTSFALSGLGVVLADPPPQLNTTAFALILLYALTRWGSGRELVLAGAVVVAGVGLSFLTTPATTENIIGSIAVVLIATVLGVVFRARASLRAQRLEQARLQERENLARDLHDTVAHHVSAIAIRAQAGLATGATDPAAASEALRVIETEAATTLRELRTIVRVLRFDDDPMRAPVDGVARLHELAAGVDVLPVRLRTEGDLDALPETVATALYRLAQESITNARRHATGATRIDVEVAVAAETVRLVVRDDGRVSGPSGESGFGLVGMRERVAALGGEFSAGPDAAGGWTVSAQLPWSAAGAR